MAERLGRYTLESKLATGGMAEVFLARQSGPKGFEKLCVVKRMLPHLVEEESFVRMFLDEARLAAQLNHPGIAQIFDFGEVNGAYFLAMEYVAGASLRKVVKDHARDGMFVPPAHCARLIADAAAALHYAHVALGTDGQPLRVIHRDVSPQNILLGTSGVVKLIDFGVAKARSATQKTAEGLVKGKFAYMSPEQIRGQPLDHRSDIFSLGLVLYELLASRRAFLGDNDVAIMKSAMRMAIEPLAHLRSDVPKGLHAILERALQKERENRYLTASEMQDELERFLHSSGRALTGADLGRLVTEAPLPRRESGETPSSAGAAVAAKGQSGAFWEGQPNEPTVLDPQLTPPGVERSLRELSHALEAPTREVSPPAELLQKGAAAPAPRPPPRPTVRDISRPPAAESSPSSQGAQVVAAAESSASLLRKALRRNRGPTLALGLLAGVVITAAVAYGWQQRKPPPAPVAEESPPALAPFPSPPLPPLPEAPPPSAPPLVAAPPAADPAVRPARGEGPAHPAAPAHSAGTLLATSTPSVSLSIDGQPRGRTPLKIALPVGEHTLTFRDDALGLNHTSRVEVAREKEARADWRPAKGTVVFRATPYAEVFLEQRSLGLTPLDPLELWEGKHSFRFVNRETNRSETREVNVPAGEKVVVKVDLRAP